MKRSIWRGITTEGVPVLIAEVTEIGREEWPRPRKNQYMIVGQVEAAEEAKLVFTLSCLSTIGKGRWLGRVFGHSGGKGISMVLRRDRPELVLAEVHRRVSSIVREYCPDVQPEVEECAVAYYTPEA